MTDEMRWNQVKFVTGNADKVEEASKILNWQLEQISTLMIDEIQTHDINKIVVKIDSQYFRLTEVDYLLGNPEKAKKELGWEPKVKFTELVKIMVGADFIKQKVRHEKK